MIAAHATDATDQTWLIPVQIYLRSAFPAARVQMDSASLSDLRFWIFVTLTISTLAAIDAIRRRGAAAAWRAAPVDLDARLSHWSLRPCVRHIFHALQTAVFGMQIAALWINVSRSTQSER